MTLPKGKGAALDWLRPRVRRASVPPTIRFTAAEWQTAPEPIVERLQETFGTAVVVVRSSAWGEDVEGDSGAGRFLSVLDVRVDDARRVRRAVESVLESYRGRGRSFCPVDEVVVQSQVVLPAAAGVLYTRDLVTDAPYCVLSLDRSSGRSNSVTSGEEAEARTLFVGPGADLTSLPRDVRGVLALGRELERLTEVPRLDVEFAVTVDGDVHLLQARPMPPAQSTRPSSAAVSAALDRMEASLPALLGPHPRQLGEATVLTTMSDWNPAEMIGQTPRPLALSLYQRLIGRRAWAVGRAALGYRDLTCEPLILSLEGRPYVDVRASLASLVPAAIPDPVARRWVEHGIRKLREDPRLHDRIEFEVALPCLPLDFAPARRRLSDAGLDGREIEGFRVHLRDLTDAVIQQRRQPFARQAERLHELERRRLAVLARPDLSAARRAALLLDDCEALGTTTFALLARYAFLALDLLHSLVSARVLTSAEREELLRGIPTVASRLAFDLPRLDRRALVERYGHLRPSSYDITSPSYARAWDSYFATVPGSTVPEVADPEPGAAAAVLDAHADEIAVLLRDAGLTSTPAQLRDFILQAIPAREEGKFAFTRTLDAALIELEGLGFGADEMSFVPVEAVLTGADLTAAARAGREGWEVARALRLPHVISSAGQVRVFELEHWRPTFVSTRSVVAEPVVLSEGTPPESVDGRVALIRSADPGYDWLFCRPIAGLVTQFGGVGSHMAIRAAEFGIPAAIGCGEPLFERLAAAPRVLLDGAARKVKPAR